METGRIDREREQRLDRRFELIFDLRRSVRYHSARRAFFTRQSRLISFASVVFGGSTIAALLSAAPEWVALSAAGAVAVSQAAELVFDLSGKAMRHEGLYRDFIALEQRAEVCGEEMTEAQLREIVADRLRLEAGEPPILRWLGVLCHNELAGSMGEDRHVVPVSWLQRQLANYVDLGPVHRDVSKADAGQKPPFEAPSNA